jgi:V8-like Glu-specific endopeptidase
VRTAALVGAAALLAGCTGGVAVDGRTAAITAGSPDTDDPAVVAVVARRLRCDEQATVLCSGTLVSPRVVVSSAHCLPNPTALLEVYFGSDVANDAGGQFVVVAQAEADPAYDPTTHEHDLLLLALAEDAPAAPLALPAQPLDGGAVGKSARIVGFGATQAGAPPSGVKAEGTMTVSEVDAATFQTTVAPGNSCKGDSGGPVLVDDGAGGERFVGLTTSGDVDCASFALNLRVDPLVAQIQAFIDQAATLPAGEPDGTIARTALCTTACASNADCPDGLACFPTSPEESQCLLAGPAVTSYGDSCASDADCGGKTCARLWPSGAGACRCASPCMGGPKPPMMMGKGDGCAMARGATAARPWALCLVALASLAAVRRRLRRA